MAVEAGAAALGLVSEMPSGPGVIDEATIWDIAAWAPPAVATFLLTSRGDARGIADQVRRTAVSTVQICDRPEPGTVPALRRDFPSLKLVRVVHVTGPESVEEAAEAATDADAILLDSGNPSAARKELGGTGRRHDWRLSAEIVRRVSAPVFLAGGLTPANVAEAIGAVRPWGLDLCSGVRTDGRLDAALLARFFAAVRAATA
ncbi:MAG TPA: phosphoribosylanthranilate isomerase [Vicinamibacteria bacterium]|nr:phosphoribosylanthranilate isomerase [Vicinamibacteria bacterium]